MQRRHKKAWRAVSALQGVVSGEGGLQRMQILDLLQTLDSKDFCAVRLRREQGAGLHRPTIHQDGACPTIACITADMGARQSRMLAYEFNKKGARLDLGTYHAFIDLD